MARICIIFAGREDRMSILMMYLRKALEKKYIDQVHVWECCRNESDRAWVNSLVDVDIHVKKAKEYQEIYEYYQDSDDVFMKVDDDIVYLNIDEIPNIFDFLDKQTDNLMFISPVCINNPTHYNLTNIPALLRHGCSGVVDTMADVSHMKQVHALFTRHFHDVRLNFFTTLINRPYEPCGVRSPKLDSIRTCGHSVGCAWGIEYQGYIPINTIFFRKQLCKYIADKKDGINDEIYVNYPLLGDEWVNMVYPCIFGSHLSYGGQEHQLDAISVAEIIQDYKTLANSLLCEK
jgi:hypothetical protein